MTCSATTTSPPGEQHDAPVGGPDEQAAQGRAGAVAGEVGNQLAGLGVDVAQASLYTRLGRNGVPFMVLAVRISVTITGTIGLRPIPRR